MRQSCRHRQFFRRQVFGCLPKHTKAGPPVSGFSARDSVWRPRRVPARPLSGPVGRLLVIRVIVLPLLRQPPVSLKGTARAYSN